MPSAHQPMQNSLPAGAEASAFDRSDGGMAELALIVTGASWLRHFDLNDL